MKAPPKRLVDDAAVAPEMHDALDRAIRTSPQPYDAEAGLARFQTAIAAGLGATATAAAVGKSIGKALWWGIAAIGTAGVIAGAGWVVSERASPAEPSHVRRSEPAAEPARPRHAERAEVVAMPLPAPVEGAHEEAPARRRPEPRVSVDPTPRQPAEVETDPDELLRRETSQMAETRRHLATSPETALRLALEAEREFERPFFREEREAIIVFALDRLGRRDEARARAAPFVARYPNGPFTSRIRIILDGSATR